MANKNQGFLGRMNNGLNEFGDKLMNMSPGQMGLLQGGLSLLSPIQAGGNNASHLRDALGTGFNSIQQAQLAKQAEETAKKKQLLDTYGKMGPLLKDLDGPGKQRVMAALQENRLPTPESLSYQAPLGSKASRFTGQYTNPVTGETSDRNFWERDGVISLSPDGSQQIDAKDIRKSEAGGNTNIDVHTGNQYSPEQLTQNAMRDIDFERIKKSSSDAAGIDKSLANINFARQMNETGITSPGAQITRKARETGYAIVKAFGGDPEGMFVGLDNQQAFEATTMSFIMEQIAQTKGAVSDTEMELFRKSVANATNTQEANRLILNMAETTLRGQRAFSQFQREYMETNGNLKQADDAWEAFIKDGNEANLASGFALPEEGFSRASWSPFTQPEAQMSDADILQEMQRLGGQ